MTNAKAGPHSPAFFVRRCGQERRRTAGARLATGVVSLALLAAPGPGAASERTVARDFDAVLPVGRPVCYVGRPTDPLIARIRLHRLEQTMAANPEETGPDRGVLALVDVTPRRDAGADAGSALGGRAYCSVSEKLGAISCSDDGGCDRADRLRLSRTEDGVRLSFRGPFSFAGAGCGAAEDDAGSGSSPGLDLPDPRSSASSFDLMARPLEDCR